MPTHAKPNVASTSRRTIKDKTVGTERSPPAFVPSERDIRDATSALKAIAQAAFTQTMTLLSDHLGSPAAARLWLVTPSPEFGSTPLTAIQNGEAEAVLAFLEAQWGPGSVLA